MASVVRFSIRDLLVAITLVALGLAAMFNANLWWQGTLWALVPALLALAVLFTVYWRGEAQAGWLGFLVFGASYLLLFLLMQIPGNPIGNRLCRATERSPPGKSLDGQGVVPGCKCSAAGQSRRLSGIRPG